MANWIFGPQSRQSNQITSLQIQTSAYGKVLTVAFGRTRLAPNLVWYKNFKFVNPSSGKGKGGGKSSKKGAQSYYTADIVLALCEGIVTSIPTVYYNQTSTATLAQKGLTLFEGQVGQPIWSYLTSHYPDDAVPFSGVATLDAETFNLGSSGAIPNLGFEVITNFAESACLDADASLVGYAMLTNAQYGMFMPTQYVGSVQSAEETFEIPTSLTVTVSEAANFYINLAVSVGGVLLDCVSSSPAAGQYSFAAGIYTFNVAQLGGTATIEYVWLGTWSNFQNYVLASGLWISPFYDSQSQANQVLSDFSKFLNSEFVWSSGVLNIIPRGMTNLDGGQVAVTCISGGGLINQNAFWLYKGPDISLTDDSNTATLNASPNQTVASNIAVPHGKWYVEFDTSAGGSMAVGGGAIWGLSGGVPYPDIQSIFSNSTFGYTTAGCVGRMLSPPAGWPTTCTFGYCQIDAWTPGDKIGMAIDYDPAFSGNLHIWFRVIHLGVASAWNDSDDVGLPSDPAANTGFFSGAGDNPFSPFGPGMLLMASFYSATDSSVTLNAGPFFAATPPTGFTGLNTYKQYTAPTPVFDLGEDDFMPNTAGSSTSASLSDDPIIITRKRAADQITTVQVEFLDRDNQYAASIAEQTDMALIDATRGRRFSGAQSAHMFTTAQAANISAELLLQKEYALKQYSFVLDERYIVLDPMDLVTLTDAATYLNRELVRIIEMTEQDDGTIAFLAEEIPGGQNGGSGAGHGVPALYNFNSGTGFAPNTDVDPGPVNPPFMFVTPPALSGGVLEGTALLSGANPNWGGCNVWISLDEGVSYTQIGVKVGADAMGYTTTTFPANPSPDVTDTLGVNVTESFGQIVSATPTDAVAGRSLAFMNGELIGYTDATLTSTYHYNLDTYITRGMYGTPILDQLSSGMPFGVVSPNSFSFPFTSTDIGTTIYLKFPSFNIYGGGQQTLAEAVAYPFVLGVPAPMMIIASENLAAGALVNVWDNSGVSNVRNANATDGTKPAEGFVLDAITAGNPVLVYWPSSTITGLTGLTPGTQYYLDTSGAGGVTATAPSTTGNYVQKVGKALSATSLIFLPQPGIVVP